LTAMALGGAVVPRSAHAVCSTGALQVCASFDASVFSTVTSTGTHYFLTLKVWNLYDASNSATGQSNVITWAGIGSNWTGTATLVSATRGVGGASIGWSLVTHINNNPVGTQIDFAAVGANGINNGLIGCGETPQGSQLATCAGVPLVLTFETTGTGAYADQAFDLSGAVEGWHSQAINGTSCSGWFSTDGQTTTTVTSSDCASVVPEPVTLTLLATGLVGIGGLGIVRRRRGWDVKST